MENVRESIQHPLHPHALVLNHEEQSDQIKEARCSACLESLSFGSSFSCGECKFHIHKRCADAPLRIDQPPFHCESFSYLRLMSSRPSHVIYTCVLCHETRKEMFLYLCTSCYFTLDIKCALLMFHKVNGDEFRELKHFAHEHHQLNFIENPKDELERVDCYWCRKPLEDSVYVCLQCRFYLHKKCAKLPSQFDHPSHRTHPLVLECLFENPFCKVCQTEQWGVFLRCSPCKLDIHIKCAWPPPIIEDSPHHDHPFIRLFRDDLFTCDACGTEGNYISYICAICNIQIHQKCISLSRIIKTTRHHHYIFHKYFLYKNEFDENQECQICFKQVKTEYGNYYCLKQDCKFVAHVKCAMEEEMYDVIDQANDEDEESSENSAMNSSITRVIESNEQGEAMKIEHFSHGHYLTLGNKIKEDDDDKCCDGCMLSISTPFYFCSQSQCEFLLHKACAELPRKKRLWFHRPLTTLDFLDVFVCARCNRLCSGLLYRINEESVTNFCMRCARIMSHTFICHGHNHSLFFYFKFQGKCNACGAACENGAFKCKDCTFALDFGCVKLPETTRHKCDEHILTLAFHEENDDSEQHYCDVCEEKRHPNLWFYHCAICDKSTHPKCVLGTFPFFKVKIGVRFPYDYHPHRHHLFFVEKNIYDMICCSVCEKPIHDVALECKDDCSYIIHDYCFLQEWYPLRVC